MNVQHKQLSNGQWFTFSFFEQMANVGSEIFRTISWRKKNADYSQQAFDRGLELLDLTISDKKNQDRLKELLRLREVLADYFAFENIYKSSDEKWQNYFYAFNFAASIANHK